jgi:two-component system cell cycle response regulator DivK
MPATDLQDTPAAELTGKVVCIEDEPINLAIVEDLLKQFPNVQLLKATTGAEGIRLVRAERPDFVLLDMHLPDTSGLEVVRQLNEDIANWGLRVTILTGDTLTMDIIKALSLGAFEYWVKPIDASVLESGLRRALTARKAHPGRRFPH